MYQRDYLLRLIEQFAQVLAIILRLKRSGQHHEALSVVEQALQQLAGITLTDTDTLPAEQLVALVRLKQQRFPSQTGAAEQLIVLAALLEEAAELAVATPGAELKTSRRLKALQISLAVLLEDDPASAQAAAAVPRLVEHLAAYELPASTKEQLWTYAERTGQFAMAEDWLFEVLADVPVTDALIRRGIAFYRRLCDRSETELRNGGLPRAEVLTGLAELQSMLTDHDRGN